jgi:hypothetical protein
MTAQEYVAAVLACYVALPDTPDRSRKPDRALAHRLFADHLDLATVKEAFLLATARRYFRTTKDPPLEPIHSLAYFVPVIRELTRTPLPPGYIDHVKGQLASGFPNLGIPPLHFPIPW